MKDESENDRKRRKTSTEENSVTIYEEMLKKTQEEDRKKDIRQKVLDSDVRKLTFVRKNKVNINPS